MKLPRVFRLPRLCAGLLAMLVLLGALAPAAQAAQERETIRVGFFAFDGYHSIDEKGVRSGYGYEFLQMISRYLDVQYEYIGYENSWDDMLGMLAAGEIDLVTSAQATPERLAEFAYSKPIGSSSAMLTTRSDNDAIVATNYSTYDGITIGLLVGNSRNEDLAVFAEEKGFSYTPVYFKLHTELEQALQSGQIDAALTSSLRQIKHERVLDYFAVEQFYTVLRKENTALLEKINYAIDQLNAVEGDWKNNLNNKYYFHWEERDLTFTPEEQALIGQYASGEKELVVSVCTDKEPYAYVENGVPKGILLDYFAALANYVGVPYTVVAPADRKEYTCWCEEENVANVFLDGRFANIQQAEARGKAITTAYTTMRLAMVVRRDFDGVIDTLAVAEGQGLFGIEDGLAPNAVRLSMDSREDAMRAVLKGDADATFVYLYTAQQFVNHDERGLLTYTMLEEPTYDYHISFASDVDRALSGVFTKAIYAMPAGTFENIASEYTSYKAKDLDLTTWVRIHPLPTLGAGAAVLFIIALIFMLVERQKAVRVGQQRSKELLAYAEQAERANRAKSDFLANMSHDIRTPMNAIVGFANLMEHELDDKQKLREHIRKILVSSRHLLSLINDVLDMSRIEANQIVLSPEQISLRDQIAQAEQIARVEADRRKQTFTVSLQPLAHDAVLADGARLRQILLNLLSNAVKYTPEGGTISLEAEELPCEQEDTAQYRFVVTDNGCGMTPEFLSRIFEPFVRSEASVTNKIQGTGLGMSITKSLVDNMGGEIRAESTCGEGSRFTLLLCFPIAEAGSVESNEPDAEDDTFRGLRFLCAEDNALNAEILEATIRLYGGSCTICPDGVQLVEAFESSAPGAYDVILTDIQMPNRNGLDAARAIRASAHPNAGSIPIIAMTANAFAEDVARSMDAGMNAHISKPLSADTLKQTVARLCRPDAPEADA